MTAEGPTGSPLRQQIAEAIARRTCECPRWVHAPYRDCPDAGDAADAVLALLNLTEEHGTMLGNDDLTVIDSYRYVTPWLPTPPDTSGVTQNVGPNEKV